MGEKPNLTYFGVFIILSYILLGTHSKVKEAFIDLLASLWLNFDLMTGAESQSLVTGPGTMAQTPRSHVLNE